jgi:hypothetical protein
MSFFFFRFWFGAADGAIRKSKRHHAELRKLHSATVRLLMVNPFINIDEA